MYHYVYRTQEGLRYYFGVRSSKVPPDQDRKYIGSGMSILYGFHFKPRIKTIIAEYPSRHDAEIAESLLIKEHYGKTHCMNRRITSPRKPKNV
jgi:hypothetical protein